jgi:teichuronic acid biosynthesis glycosyltransferase TuaG
LAHEDKKNKGVAISRALAIANANGEYISFLDADDFFSVDKLKKHIEVFDEFGNVLLVHSSANCLNESINSFFYEFKFHKINEQYSLLEGDFLKKNFICNSSVTVRSKFLKKIELSFPQLFQYEDWITWILLAQQGDFYFIDSPLCTYRYHENSSTSQLFKNKISFMYAKLEMLYILLHRLETKSMKIKIENALRHHLLQISALYKLDEHENTNSIFKKLLLKIVKLFKIK